MPAYNANPNSSYNPPLLMQSGVPAYCYGSFNDRAARTRMTVSNVALTTNVATLTVQVIEGNIPVAGSAIWVQGTTSTSGLFNVGSSTTPITLSTVTINATTGAGTITFALTHADVVSVANSGMVTVVTPEVSEDIANGSSVAWAVPSQPSQLNQGKSIKTELSFPTVPTTLLVVLQEAIVNTDANFSTLATVASVAASTATITNPTITVVEGRFYRLNVSTLAGSGKIVAKLLV